MVRDVGLFGFEKFIGLPAAAETEVLADLGGAEVALAILVSNEEFEDATGEVKGRGNELRGESIGEFDRDLHGLTFLEGGGGC